MLYITATSKNATHPPPSHRDAQAQETVALAKEAGKSGDPIATRNGKMIDAPIVARARSVLALGQRFEDQAKPLQKPETI